MDARSSDALPSKLRSDCALVKVPNQAWKHTIVVVFWSGCHATSLICALRSRRLVKSLENNGKTY